jgi:hypothetical protein
MSMTNPDYRALCARMADELDHYRQLLMDDRRETHALATEARAALSQPEPVAPTDEEIAQFVDAWWENMQGFAPHGDKTVYTVFEFVAREHFADFARDALARWGTPANTTSEENLDG